MTCPSAWGPEKCQAESGPPGCGPDDWHPAKRLGSMQEADGEWCPQIDRTWSNPSRCSFKVGTQRPWAGKLAGSTRCKAGRIPSKAGREQERNGDACPHAGMGRLETGPAHPPANADARPANLFVGLSTDLTFGKLLQSAQVMWSLVKGGHRSVGRPLGDRCKNTVQKCMQLGPLLAQ